jgi:hypothetical protein
MGRCTLVPFALLIFAPQMAWAQAEGEAPPPPAEGGASNAPPSGAPSAAPPSQYYMEPGARNDAPPGPPAGAPPPPGYYEPPPPGYYAQPVWEPPPPPKPHHRAPKTAFWLGARVGWFIPFGTLWNRYHPPAGQQLDYYESVNWSEYASAGPMLEGDVGMRFSRYYNVFLAWEHASLGAGSAEPAAYGGQDHGETDYYAIGLRFSSDADRVGFLTEIDLGYRRFRAVWADGTELQFTQAPLEFRIGLGADIRLGPWFSLSPMVTLGAGVFGDAEAVAPDGSRSNVLNPNDENGGHGWLTLQLGGHFDLPPGNGD